MGNPIQPFWLERYFAQYEFKAPYLLSPSDCESLSLKDVLGMADAEDLERWEKLSLGYTESAGLPGLRREIASLYSNTNPDDILVLAPEEGIYITMRALLSPGDEVIVLTPCYQSLVEVARSVGCGIMEWPLLSAGDHWELNREQLISLISPRTKMLVVNFPHNPTGFLPKREDYQYLIELSREHDLWLFSDEMYRYLEHDPTCRLPGMVDLYPKGITLGGMSKAFSLPGLRIGWLATQNRTAMEALSTYKDYTTICNSAPGELLALIALRSRDGILARNLDLIQSNLAAAHDFFYTFSRYVNWYRPQGGSIAFPEWIGPKSLDQACLELVNDYGVMVVPGHYFNYPGSHFRVGLGRRNFPEALGRVEAYLQQMA